MESLAFFENRPIFPIADIREFSDVISFKRFRRSTLNEYIEFLRTTLMPYLRRWAELVSDFVIRSPLVRQRALELANMPSPHSPNRSNQEFFIFDDEAREIPILGYIYCSKADAETYFRNRCIGGNGKLIIATNLRPDRFWSSRKEILEMHNEVFPRNYSNLEEFECCVAICISGTFEERVNAAGTVTFWERYGSHRIAYDLLMVGARCLHDANERGIMREVMQEVVDKHVALA